MIAAFIFTQFLFQGTHSSIPFPPHFEYWVLGFAIVLSAAFFYFSYFIVVDLREKIRYTGPSKSEKLAFKEILSDPKTVEYAFISQPDERGNTHLRVIFIQRHPLARYGEILLLNYRYSAEQILHEGGVKIIRN